MFVKQPLALPGSGKRQILLFLSNGGFSLSSLCSPLPELVYPQEMEFLDQRNYKTSKDTFLARGMRNTVGQVGAIC